MKLTLPTCLAYLASFVGLILLTTTAPAQGLQPGFDKAQYLELLKVSAQFGDSTYRARFPKPQRFRSTYRSAVVGLDNRWDLWTDGGNTALINLRGTTANSVSWLANLYAAMVPAKGKLQLADNEPFPYQLADNPRAAVHVGWLVSMAFLSRDILPKLDSSYRHGTRNVLIMGHSQGGAIAFLLTAYLYHLQRQGKLPADLRWKTYCSAGPKPGNLYFAYDYEALTQGGWAYNVVNSADWVPQVPFSIQTVNDLNPTNPLAGADLLIKKQPLLKRIVLRKVYNDLSKPALQAQKNYQTYLGRIAARTVQKNLAGYVPPTYYPSNDYVRTGSTIVLLADSAYYRRFPDRPDQVFTHHFHPAYLFLTETRLPPLGMASELGSATAPRERLVGSWQLDSLITPGTSLGALYPEGVPSLRFDGPRAWGSTGCTQFNVPILVTDSTLGFPVAMAMTRQACSGAGDTRFLAALKRVNRYAVTATTLTLLSGEVALLRFIRK